MDDVYYDSKYLEEEGPSLMVAWQAEIIYQRRLPCEEDEDFV